MLGARLQRARIFQAHEPCTASEGKNQARGDLILAGTVGQCLAGQQLATITLQIIALKEFGGSRTVGKDRGFGQGLGRLLQ